MRISDWSSDVCSSDLGRKQLFAIGDAVFLAHVFKAGRLPGFVARLDDERGHPGLELIGVRLEPAMFGLHESEGERIEGLRSEERRVGKECVSTCRSGWSPDH